MKNEWNRVMQGYVDQFSNYPVIEDPEKIAELLQLWRNKKDRLAYDQLVYGNVKLIISVARKNYFYSGVPPDDLVQQGFIGMMRALKTFDPALSSLSTYATIWIWAEMGRQVPSTTTKRAYSLPPKIYQNVALIATSIKSFCVKHGRRPDDQELNDWIHTADGTDKETQSTKRMTVREVELCRRLLSEKYPSLDAPLGISNGPKARDERVLSDIVADPTVDLEKTLERRHSLNKIAEEVNKLEPKARMVLRSRFIDEVTLREVSEYLNLSRERIRQIEKKALETIEQSLRAKNRMLRLKNA